MNGGDEHTAKTLYLSDLDGTLIRSDEKISLYTADTVNRLVKSGGHFSYATARSFITAEKVTWGLNADITVICYNGAFIIGNATKEILLANYFKLEKSEEIQRILTECGIFPIVYAYINGKEQFSFLSQNVNPAMRLFLDSRTGDIRRREVQSENALL